jgi:DNA processing protein
MCAALNYYLALNEINPFGFSHFKKLINTFGELPSAFNASVKQLMAAGLSENMAHDVASFDWRRIESSFQWQEADDQYILTLDDERYPSLLREIASPPIVIYIKGHLDCLQRPQLAMVGSRYPTPMGQENAKCFAQVLAKAGLVITSGLALGIDTASHQGALQADQATIAVLGTGLSTIYPARNRWLAQQVAEKGALVSEFPLAMGVRRENFPRRNRIISGLSMGVLVVEAAAESGSLITARFALEQGREVFAIPGSIHNALSKGCHRLLSDGAKLVQSADDVVAELLPMVVVDREASNSARPKLSKCAERILSCIDEAPTPVELILQRSGFEISMLSAELLDLEMCGRIGSTVGGYQKLSC